MSFHSVALKSHFCPKYISPCNTGLQKGHHGVDAGVLVTAFLHSCPWNGGMPQGLMQGKDAILGPEYSTVASPCHARGALGLFSIPDSSPVWNNTHFSQWRWCLTYANAKVSDEILPNVETFTIFYQKIPCVLRCTTILWSTGNERNAINHNYKMPLTVRDM